MANRETEFACSLEEQKLQTLAHCEGFDSVEDLLENSVTDSLVAGICISEYCDATEHYEPDQAAGYCYECGAPTLLSCLILADLI